ncbi:hypothetical protein EJB05_22996 [Eragrostis curvula]|uniref:Proline-rich protein n=1 Tax=Eragrostis curvula TaxID=38414 RepID=A0A5J9V726_9POAL|nr:hypothetical protein EJB05_22996 [Eragrostis curvula]
MGSLPRGLLVSVCAILLVAVLAHAAEPETASMVIGLAKCADCTRKNMNAEAVFKGLQVALKCKNAKGEFETKAVAKVDKSGAFSVPLTSDLLREDGEMKQDCFAQLHGASRQPCPGQEPSWIVRPSSDDDGKKKNFIAVAGKMHYSSKECASAFLCDPFHKKHLFHKKPIEIPHVHKKPIEIPHFHKKPVEIPHFHKKPVEIPHFHKKPVVIPHFHKKPVPVPEHKPPTPVPVYTHPTPVPEHKPPTPEYSHTSPTPIYHPPAEQKTQNPMTDPEKFKKLLPFIKKKPFFFPKFKKFPPGKEEIKA